MRISNFPRIIETAQKMPATALSRYKVLMDMNSSSMQGKLLEQNAVPQKRLRRLS
jgi:hypothetical protein